MVAPVLEEIAAEQSGSLTVAKLDVDANPATARDFQVVSIPTMILFKDGQPVKRIVGAKGKAALLRELADVVCLTNRHAPPPPRSSAASSARPYRDESVIGGFACGFPECGKRLRQCLLPVCIVRA